MKEDNTFEEGQIFQPYPEISNELIRYVSGRWERSLDTGKTYSYDKAMQEKDKADALSIDSILVLDEEEERLTFEKNEAIEASYQAFKEDKKRPKYERSNYSIPDGALIKANEGILTNDIDDALKSLVDRKPQAVEWFPMTIRELLRDYCADNSEFDINAYTDEISSRISSRAEVLSVTYPAFKAEFKYSAAASLKKRLAEILNEFKSTNQTESILSVIKSDDRVKNKPLLSEAENKSGRKQTQKTHITDIWLGDEDSFWRIAKTYANNYLSEKDGKTIWSTENSGISYLAGFTRVCINRGWLAKNGHSAPTFKRVYQSTFNIEFDGTPFKQGNLIDIDDKYCDPFMGIEYKI